MFQGFRKDASAEGRAALTWHGGRAALARRHAGTPERPAFDAAVVDLALDEHGSPAFRELTVGNRPLGAAPLSTVLPHASYQLLLEELPNVPAEELRKAVGWRIRDRLETALEESVIELLDMPPLARPGSKPSAYAVITSREAVRARVEPLRRARLKLDAIDIPELCMRNIARYLPQDRDGVAFLHFTPDCGYLTITRRGVLYLIRHIEAGRAQLEDSAAPDAGLSSTISLDIQRSLDYYESNYDLPPVAELVLGPGHLDTLAMSLRQQLGLRVERLKLDDLFALGAELDEDTAADCLFAVGAALRVDDAGAAGN